MIVWITIAFLVVGLLLIWIGSDWMTDSLVPVAKFLGTSYIAIASILVSIMLSVPEVFTAIYSYYMGFLDISLGVIIGSVMANIGLMTGLSAIIKPLHVNKEMVVRDGLFALFIIAILFTQGSDFAYSRTEGWVLLLLFVPYAVNVWFSEKWAERNKKQKLLELEKDLEDIGFGPFKLAPGPFAFILGVGLLLIGSYLFSRSLVSIAELTTIPSAIIGLTIGAIGPTVPNIFSAIQGTLKNYKTIAIAETFGSNIFTLLVTMGLVIVLKPMEITTRLLFFDIAWMGIMHLVMLLFIIKGFIAKESAILRGEGIALLFFYLILLAVNVIF
ncbi:MAG: sodium:calcium antiporter [Nanoarchaeota archaeon]